MSIRFIWGRAGSGKTSRCLNEIRRKVGEAGDGPLLMLVPEQATFQTETALIGGLPQKGTLRAQAISFRRLAYRVMQETGGTALIHIADTGKKMLLHKIVLACRNRLKHFGHAAGQTGLLDGLNEVHTEMKRYGIDGETLLRHADRFGAEGPSLATPDKLHDIGIVLGLLEQALEGRYVDSEDYLAMLCAQAGDSAYLRGAEVWIDGFHGYTPQEMAVLGALLRVCARVTVTVTVDRNVPAGDEPDELDLFYPTALTMVRLKRLAMELDVPEEEAFALPDPAFVRFAGSPRLAHLERHFSDRKAFRQAGNPGADDLVLVAAAGRRTEVEAAARDMIRLVRDEGYRWRDLSVMVRDLAHYQDLIGTVFRDYGIPFFIDAKRQVAHHPLIEFLRSAMETVSGGWRYESVFRCVKTDFLLPADVPEAEARAAMDRLENYVLAFGIHGRAWTQDEPWTFAMRRSLENDDGDAAVREREEVRLEEVNRSRAAVVAPLLCLQTAMKSAGSVREMTEALFRLLEDVGAADRLERWSRSCRENGKLDKAREHEGVWPSVLAVFDQLVEMIGEESLAPEMYAKLLETGLDAIRLGLVPPALDQVLVGSIDRTRSGTVKAAYLLGVGDGVIPARVEESSLLSEREREWLEATGLQVALGSRRRLLDEQFMAYAALSAPTNRLWISYPLADEEGKSLMPSELIRRIEKMFSGLAVRYPANDPSAEGEDGAWDYIAHPERTLTDLVVQLERWTKGRPIPEVWWHAYNWFCERPEWSGRLATAVQALFRTNGEDRLSPETSRGLYGERLTTSVSRMELFMSCPFAHFATYGLRLRERSMFRLESPDIGQLFHAALSLIARELLESGRDWGELGAEECRELAAEAVGRLVPRLRSQILLSTKRYHYIAGKLRETITRASEALGLQSRRGAFVPVGLEVDFGPGGPLPPLLLPDGHGGELRVVGRIDRVDRAKLDNGVFLRVIDYKSSKTTLDLANVFYGLSLQMLTYLDVVVSHAEAWLGERAEPAGVLYFHVHNPLIPSSGPMSRERAEEERFKRFKMNGMLLADKEVAQAMDGSLQSGWSQMLPVGLKSDGGFYSNSSVMTPGEWRSLRGHVRGVVSRIGSEIMDGAVAIEPYKLGQETPCRFCSYKPVCQFDPDMEQNRYRVLGGRSKGDVWQTIEQERMATAEDSHDEAGKGGGEA